MPRGCEKFVPLEDYGAFVIPIGDAAIVLDRDDFTHPYPGSMEPPSPVSSTPLEDGARLVRIRKRKVGWARTRVILAALRLGMVEDAAEAVIDVPFTYEGEPPSAHPDLGSALKEIEIVRSGSGFLMWGLCRLSGEGPEAVCDRRMFVLDGGRFRVTDSETVSTVSRGSMTASIEYRKGLFVLRIEGPDVIAEEPLSKRGRIPHIRGFDGSSCSLDDMEFKIRGGSIVPADWRDYEHLRSRGKRLLYSGDEEHRRLFAEVSTGEYTVHKAGALFIATKGARTTIDESEESEER
ncbi:MAG: hypothetical protein IKH98_06565 [Candidatus Methanomethylophilaceae archaeon]|nr:hypothetical protein [Candidatus Methanomethylophilaceae archaeon]